jgi:hypothetical protein
VASGSNVQISLSGDDANVSINLLPKGCRNVNILTNSNSEGGLLFYENNNDTGYHIGLKAPAGLTKSTIFTLPINDVTNNQIIKTDGSGNLSFISYPSNLNFITTKSDFPIASRGVITLTDNVTYFITTNIDLTGDRLVSGSNTTIIGGSSENCTLTSTGLGVGVPLLTIEYTTPIRNISFVNVLF